MKKCSFYTRKTGGIVECVNGWTDGVYNYYKNGDLWFCIVPEVGIAAVTGNSRKDVVSQVYDHDIAAKIAAIMDRDGEKPHRGKIYYNASGEPFFIYNRRREYLKDYIRV